jgi:hypothetical protein
MNVLRVKSTALTMRTPFSVVAVFIASLVFMGYRAAYIDRTSNAVSWDALGYYMYLPGAFIYHDLRDLEWILGIDSTYSVTPNGLYQAQLLDSGTYTGKYLAGVAIMQLPFFIAGHFAAGIMGFPQDGFTWPYQYAILFGAVFWGIMGLIFLMLVLRMYFDDLVTAIVILLVALASNLIQYVSVDGGMSHAYILPLYSALLWLTAQWHRLPRGHVALLGGLVTGLAVMSRPTEALMIFIPILWDTHDKNASRLKWQMVRENRSHIWLSILGGFLGVLPQLVYWKYTTGSFIYDVGSKWVFLNPWFRVLFGPEKGWFLYTPVAILMVLGLFMMKGRPFGRAVLTFCLLNIWIIIAWNDWRYGASYSTRALAQSYPVFAFGLACAVEHILQRGWGFALAVVSVLLVWLNFHQLAIYNNYTLESFSPLLRLFP